MMTNHDMTFQFMDYLIVEYIYNFFETASNTRKKTCILQKVSYFSILMFSFPCLGCHGGAQTVSYNKSSNLNHFSVFDLTFVGLRIVHGISNCPDMNCFVFCSNILCMNGSTGSGGGKKLRAGHVISVNNKTRHFFRFSSHQSLSS